MNTATLSHRAASRTRGGYGFRTVARMEWQQAPHGPLHLVHRGRLRGRP